MRGLLILLVLILPFFGDAQRIADLNLVATDAYVGVRFTITKGSSCNGYTIYHSLYSLNFSSIYDYAGVCGSSGADDRKSYTHTAPVPNQVNYYKVDLWPVETSKVVGILIPAETASGLLVYPNPLVANDDLLYVRLLNPQARELEGVVCNQFGKSFQPLKMAVLDNVIAIGTGDLVNGVYAIRLNDGRRDYVSKFVILR